MKSHKGATEKKPPSKVTIPVKVLGKMIVSMCHCDLS